MALVALDALGKNDLEHLAHLTLAAAREHAPEWLPDLDAAREEISDALAADKASRVVLNPRRQPIGWVSAGLSWERVWELHPLIVAIEHQRRGHGLRLVREIERLAKEAGALTMTLGTSDTINATSLSGVDLYDDTFKRLANIEVHSSHAVDFWRRAGYQIVGVIPDAEGPGKPSITLARRL
ncbi:MAG: acetyltransferase [Myxococcales bacterium]|nr:acetyltransferase [Myxococcales bacterium]